MKKTVFFILLAAVLLLPMTVFAASPESDFRFIDGLVVSYIGSDANVVIPSTINGQAVIGIYDQAFYGSSVNSVIIPEGVTSIGQWAFSQCESLVSIIIPSSVTSLGEAVFSDCSSLKYAIISENISSIPNNAFEKCTSLERLSIPSNVRSIGNYAFFDCESMTYVDLPTGVETIGNFAFNNCPLKELPNISNVTSIGTNAFGNCKFTVATIPACVNKIDAYAFQFCPLTELTFEGQPSSIDNQAFVSVGSVNSPCYLYLLDTWTDEEPKEGNGISWKGGTFNVKRADTKDITLISDGHGTVSADKVSGKKGTVVTLTAVPAESYVFNEWIETDGDVTIENNQFTIGTDDVVIIASFKKSGSAHEHTFSNEWNKDETNHWHAATCEHTDLSKGIEAHQFGVDNICDICGYEKEVPQPVHEHTFSEEWSKDETNHWHAATCEHTEMTSGFAAHTWGAGDKSNECTACGYVKPDPAHEHTFSDTWSKDETNHWHAATCEHTDKAADLYAHQFGDDNVCDVCQYVKKSPVPVDLPLYGIVITTPPNKITYTEGESFNPTGMVVNALYARPITNYSLSPFSNLIKTDTAITVSYTENGVTKTAQQPITVGPVKEPYKIIAGANQVVLTTANSAVFSSNADFSKFVRVEVDGKEVASKYYIARSGSTVITFGKDYIATLKEGKHTLRIVSTDGSASTGFTVTSLPITGDNTNLALLLTLLIASMGTLLLMAARTRKRNQD